MKFGGGGVAGGYANGPKIMFMIYFFYKIVTFFPLVNLHIVLCPNKMATWTELETYLESEMSSLNKEISGAFSEPRMSLE